jgi:hypothetical protein
MQTFITIIILTLVGGVLMGIFSGISQANKEKTFEEDVIGKGLVVTKRIPHPNCTLLIDENNKKWAIQSGTKFNKIYNYCDLLDVKIYEDGTNIGKTSSLSKAVVGGYLFGVPGALIGSSMGKKAKNECTLLKLQIVVNDLDSPYIDINFINSKVKRDSSTYRNAVASVNRIASTLTALQYASNSN